MSSLTAFEASFFTSLFPLGFSFARNSDCFSICSFIERLFLGDYWA
jgi:hypothetical protein